MTGAGATALSAAALLMWWVTGLVFHVPDRLREPMRGRDWTVLVFAGLILLLAIGICIGHGS